MENSNVKMLPRVIIWGTGRRYCQMINLIKSYEYRGMFDVVGVTSNDDFYTKIDEYPFISKKDLKEEKFDYIIVTADNYTEVTKEAESLLRCGGGVIRGRVLFQPNFDFDQYIKLMEAIPSIISRSCFGGILYHQLGLPFQSPTINMFWEEEDYYKLLSDLRGYMDKPLDFIKWGSNKEGKEYPICSLGDIQVLMNHYETYEEAELKWNLRKKRINYDNLFIVNFTQSEYWAEKFSKLPYKKKVCFTDFDMEDCINIKDIYDKNIQNKTMGMIVNETAYGRYRLFNPFQMLC